MPPQSRAPGEAVSFLDQHPDWKRYLGSFAQGIQLEQWPIPSFGDFTLVKYFQLEAALVEAESESEGVVVSPPKTRSMTAREKAPQATPSKVRADQQHILDDKWSSPFSAAKMGDQKVLYPPTEDEQIVNVALLNFLTAVTITHSDVCLRWCLARKILKFVCNGDNNEEIEYEARTDGYLRGDNDSTPYAIVEVKPYIRSSMPNTRWQETAQMAAWILEDPSSKGESFQ
jgi:hypothetical protein